MKKRIVISVSNDISTDQRVLKVAKTCYENGYDVLILGRLRANSKKMQLPYPHKRLKLLFNSSFLFYAEFNIRLFLQLLFIKSDIFLSNDTDTLVANFLVTKLKNKKLIFDAHELFPEVPELQYRPFVKKCWEFIEDSIFPHLHYSYTVCDSIAEYYHQKYNIEMKVIRNMPYYEEYTNETPKTNSEKIILYQGAINIGRGLEWVIDAMPLIDNVKLVIIGDGDIKNMLIQRVELAKLTQRVIFVDKMLPEQLKEYTKQASIGLCLLDNIGLSYYYALPNRIFDYIQAHLAILATSFPEISKIVGNYKTGILIDHYEPEYLAETINQMLNNPYPTDHFKELSTEFCWENEKKVLIAVLES
jgi:glycosyltransferase involved in cell wall biosynthesis